MFRRFARERPLQAGKLSGIVLALTLGIAGFFRIISADTIIGDSVFADGQFLALLLIPLVSLALICIVFLETIVTAFQALRRTRPLRDQITGNLGYTFVRIAEAAVALIGLAVIVPAVRMLVSESMPAPAGVGLMLGLMVVGISILLASLVRTLLELYYSAVAP